jgi:hypothetical protein
MTNGRGKVALVTGANKGIYLASPLASNTNGAALRCEGGILRALF